MFRGDQKTLSDILQMPGEFHLQAIDICINTFISHICIVWNLTPGMNALSSTCGKVPSEEHLGRNAACILEGGHLEYLSSEESSLYNVVWITWYFSDDPFYPPYMKTCEKGRKFGIRHKTQK